jgi:DNA-binding FadR family transcriptional regulator
VARLVRLLMTEQAVSWLRSQVSEGMWPIGTRIPPEADLAEELGVARNTIREAVRALTHTGVLEVRRGFGTFVRSDSEVDVVFARRLLQAKFADAADLRRAIEVEATRLACVRRTSEDIDHMRALLQRRTESDRDGNQAGFQDADYQFHRMVVHSAHNTLLDELFHCLASQVKAPIDEIADKPSVERRDQAHAEVVEAIALRDETRAIRAALVHLDVIVKQA